MKFVRGTLIELGNVMKIEIASLVTLGVYQQSSTTDVDAHRNETSNCVDQQRRAEFSPLVLSVNSESR